MSFCLKCCLSKLVAKPLMVRKPPHRAREQSFYPSQQPVNLLQAIDSSISKDSLLISTRRRKQSLSWETYMCTVTSIMCLNQLKSQIRTPWERAKTWNSRFKPIKRALQLKTKLSLIRRTWSVDRLALTWLRSAHRKMALKVQLQVKWVARQIV